MLPRKVTDELAAWKNGPHKSLVVSGQRQVGKTTAIREFARKNYENFVEFNFSIDKSAHNIFDGDLDVDSLISAIHLYRPDIDIQPGKTLIFFDEIQDCPKARESLKSFSIDGRYDVIASGSMLCVNLPKDDDSLEPLTPVGYEQHLRMNGLDFEEFCWALGIPEKAIASVKGCIRDRKEIPPAHMDVFDRAFRDFMLVGGMPEAVALFVNSKDYAAVGRLQQDLIESCRKDINRYNRGADRTKTEECFNAIPEMLARSDKKFIFAKIDGGLSRNSSAKYRNNLLWIENAGYGNMCRLVTNVYRPLESSTERNQFRVYLSDTGMLMEMYGRGAKESLFEGDRYFNKGAIAENIFAECLLKAGITPRYHRKNSGPNKMELDFVIELGRELAVIEIKSGKNRDAPSISKVPKVFSVDRLIMLENSNIYVTDDGVEHYPLFASGFISFMEKPWDGPSF